MNKKSLNKTDIDEPRINKTLSAESSLALSNDIPTGEEEARLDEILRNEISKQYQELLDLVTVFVEQDDGKELDNMQLKFTHDEKERWLALATYAEDSITFNIAALKKPEIRATIVHEIAHLICGKYINRNLGHSLEFAIICYCLQYKRGIKDKSFYRSYDTEEDISNGNFIINPMQFDANIRCLNWNSIRELVEKSMRFANDIRKSVTPLELF